MPDSNQPRPSNAKSRSGNLPVYKFYVRSGTVSWIVLAINADVAALRFVQNTLQGSLNSGRQRVNKELELLNVEAMKPLVSRLDSRIHVSEAGFAKSEAGEFVTSLVVKRWRDQIAALEKLIRSTA